ncbi:hypothetical protein [Streptosporangium canum]|uniref:hypothetical protein n=1 Tax=Streptosporangium canum TaxID=324952 RepID=UPI0037A737E2
MIPAHGHEAVFQAFNADGVAEGEKVRPVVAWNDHGAPLVLLEDRGLVDATTLQSFLLVTSKRSPEVIPGGGWMLTYLTQDGTEKTTPVIAWSVTSSDGGGYPLVRRDNHGFLTVPLNLRDLADYRVWHPDEKDVSPAVKDREATP